ncbi:GIY-YIG nuclease family protein [Oceanirhabdus seepicola]|uniref:GIY-YIG nuclease family protein n=1 Tax=Oceanirhabdus seepicola TaxID=2828781 RepID=A0A9J6P5J7_9CLOT|nr:GIY-YIG nuclease family protein [Oceanirhabdus seepicola]MCM1992090.1 GIY-YIG nuclease family protein [Oceanirhabdus seepicola]
MKKGLLEQAKNLPEQPGVYLMKDSNDIIIYIGKSKNLRNRVTSYFYDIKDRSSKIENLTNNIRNFKYITCDNELDALLFENKLIKLHKPRYNTLLKNYNNYIYIVLNMRRGYYELNWSYDEEEINGNIFGPFNSLNLVENYINMVNITYNLKKCNGFRGEKCLEYHIGNCSAPCAGEITEEEYNCVFSEIISFLKGESGAPIERAKEQMKLASEKLDFNSAARLRDMIKASELLVNQQNIINDNDLNGALIYVLKTVENKFKIYFIKNLNIIYTEVFDSNDLEDILSKCNENLQGIFNDEVVCTSLKENIDEKLILYSFITREGSIFKYDKEEK